MNIRFFLLLVGISTVILSVFFWWSAYGYYSAIHADDPIDPTLYVDLWKGKIVRGDTTIMLDTRESYEIITNDIIETDKESRATITWPDRSVTRLGANTRIIIKKMIVSRNYETIEVSYDMKRGKVWNSVIRLLLGDSYFEAHLPKDSIVAWVRGTTFEVNLDNGYIHAVEHATVLSDKTGKSLELMPGELVSSENIWIQKWREWIDTTWQEWNLLGDKTYEKIRTFELEKRLEKISSIHLWKFSPSKYVGSFLSLFPGFESISISRSMLTDNMSELFQYDESTLIEAYQKLSNESNLEIRDGIRATILQKIEMDSSKNHLREMLQNASIWESIDSGNILPSLRNKLNNTWLEVEESLKWVQDLDTKDLMNYLSWGLNRIMP